MWESGRTDGVPPVAGGHVIKQLVINVVSDRCLKNANYLTIGCGWRAIWKVDGQ